MIDERRFDTLVQHFGRAGATRRATLSLLSGGLAWAIWGRSAARATHYDCRHIGEPCRRRRDCCSGVCAGANGRKECRPHHADICQVGWRSWPCGADHACGPPASGCQCYTTTGRAPFCSSGFFSCRKCRRDRDCVQKFGFPPGSACIVCHDACDPYHGAACFKPCGA